MRSLIPTAAAVIFVCCADAGSAPAQTGAHDHQEPELMSDSVVAGKHLRVTPQWPLQQGDQARADSLVEVARAALARYADVAEATRDGYQMFAPKVKGQKVYHYSNRGNARAARRAFDATAPSALLYRPEPNGTLRLIGAMYTAPPDNSLDDLNRRIPLSIAQWHQHTSICLPPGTTLATARGGVGMGGRKPQFGPRGSISTEAACAAAGGTFKPRMLGWMVHVNLFEPPDQVWEHRH
jgi:hypothetical protein